MKLIVWITRADYEAVKRLDRNSQELPETYDEWIERESAQISAFEERGQVYKKVNIQPAKLAQYCESIGMPCDQVGRGAYAVFVNRHGSES